MWLVQCLGPAPCTVSPHAVRANGSIACVVPLHMMGSSFVRTSNAAAGGYPVPCWQFDYSICKRAGWVRGLVECDSTVRGLVSGGWPCTSTPEPRIQLAEGHGD